MHCIYFEPNYNLKGHIFCLYINIYVDQIVDVLLEINDSVRIIYNTEHANFNIGQVINGLESIYFAALPIPIQIPGQILFQAPIHQVPAVPSLPVHIPFQATMLFPTVPVHIPYPIPMIISPPITQPFFNNLAQINNTNYQQQFSEMHGNLLNLNLNYGQCIEDKVIPPSEHSYECIDNQEHSNNNDNHNDDSHMEM